MADLAELNEIARGHTDFHIRSFDGHRLVVVGSFDPSYYHGVEVHFVSVDRITLPVWFNYPEFADGGQVSDPWSAVEKPRRFVIRADCGQYEVIAESIEVVVGMVYYHDRETQLQPGEPIAPGSSDLS